MDISAFINLERYKENVFLLDDMGNSLTYQETAELADRLVSDIPGRSLVFLLCKNSLSCVAAYFGLLRKQCVPLLLDQHVDNGLLQNLTDRYHPDFVIRCTNERRADEWHVDVNRADKQHMNETTDSLFAEKTTLHPDLALLLSTSGSTGDPKLVRLSKKNLQSNAAAIAEYLQIDKTQRAVTSLPMQYTYGLSVIHSYALAGASLLVTEKTMFERDFWDALKQYKVTSLSGVPYHWNMLKRLRLTEMDLPDLKVLTQAGGKLSEDLQQFFGRWALETNRSFYIMYGQTEATARMSYLPLEMCLEKPGSIGIPIPGGTFLLQDEDGNEITGEGIEGELVYQGDNVSMGYAYSAKDLEKGDENGGVLPTGDLAVRDTDGYYYITGRKNRFLKLYGKRISLDYLEEILKKQFRGTEFACAGTDEGLGVYVVEAVQKKSGAQRTEDFTMIKSFLSEKTGIRNNNIRIFGISRLPQNASGKVMYQELPAGR